VTDQVTGLAGTVVAADAGSEVLSTVCGLAETVVQSAGRLSEKVVSTFAGPYVPLLCTLAEAVTLNVEPATLLGGLLTVTPFTLMSDVPVMLVLEPPLALSLALAGSVTCNWSIAAAAVTEKLWLEALAQVTDQVTGLAGTVVAVDVGSELSWLVCGFPEEVAQSAGRLSVNVVSAFVGP
jgi:hypothetical protein